MSAVSCVESSVVELLSAWRSLPECRRDEATAAARAALHNVGDANEKTSGEAYCCARGRTDIAPRTLVRRTSAIARVAFATAEKMERLADSENGGVTRSANISRPRCCYLTTKKQK